MPEIRIDVFGLDDIAATFQSMTPTWQGRLIGPGLGRMASVVRARAKSRNFVFRDKTGRLRRSIRARRTTGYYSGTRVHRGWAAVFAGTRRVPYAGLVEYGHGGPRPARPYPFLRRSLLETERQQAVAFEQSVVGRWPRIAQMVARRGTTRSVQASYARTISRRRRRG